MYKKLFAIGLVFLGLLSGSSNANLYSTTVSLPFIQKIDQQPKPKAQVNIVEKNGHKIGIVILDSEIEEDVAEIFISQIKKANEQEAEFIVVEINTPGGRVDSGFKMAKALENSNATIVCVVDPEAASMGYYLLQSCDIRLMTKRSMLMIHAPLVFGFSITGDESEFIKYYSQLHALTQAMVEQFCAKTNVSIEEMNQKISNGKQWWINWKEALDRKMIDGVVKSVNVVIASLASKGSLPN